MNEENKSQDDGYQEIDISNSQPEQQPEQQQAETPVKQEPEYVVEGLNALDDKKPEPEVEIEATDDEATKELDGIETEGARKRINRLVKQRKEKEEKLLLAEQQIQQLQEQLNSQDKKLKDTEIASLTNQEKSLQQQLKNSEEAYKSAYDSGDKDKMLEAQKAIADATTKLQFVDAKRWYQQDQQNKQKQEQPQQQQTQQRVKPNSLAIEWKEDNETWFQKDPIMTQGALVINQQLLQEGFDPNTKEFYNEVSRRIKKEFPHKFGEQDDPTKPAQVVAGKSRTSASSKGKIRLSQEDVRLAKKMGVPLDVYAKEKAKVEKAGDDYTTVNV
jgi:hypothetical protein